MSLANAAREFSLLTTLLGLARDQHRSLEHTDLAEFEKLMGQRHDVLAELQGLPRESEMLPENVVQLWTEFSLGYQVDTAAAADIVIRMILDQDAINEWLFNERLQVPERAG